MELSALQFVFANGVESPLVESQDAPNEELKVSFIDTSREIRYVRMKLYLGIYYTALWFEDEQERTILKDEWFNVGVSSDVWTPQQKIPEGQHIIGFKAETEGYEHGLNHVSLLLGRIGERGIVGELRFPLMEEYPSFPQFYRMQYATKK